MSNVYHRNSHGALISLDRLSAEAGSNALLNHCERAFDRFVARHRITHDEARFSLVSSGTRV